MSDSKCQRLDAISDRDQMAEREPCEHAKRFMKRTAYYGVLRYLRHKNSGCLFRCDKIDQN